MTELLIKAIDHTHPDPVKDKAGAYKKGDIVQIQPNGHRWGDKEALPLFYVFKIPNLTVEDALLYMESEMDGEFNIVTRRRFKFDFELRISAEDLERVRQNRWLVLAINQAHLEAKA